MKALLVGSLLAIPIAAGGAESAVSLRDAVDRALVNSHLLKASGAEKTAATAAAAGVRSRYLPKVVVEEGAAMTNAPTRVFMMKLDEGRFAFGGDLNHPTAAGDFRTAISLEQPLLDFSLGLQSNAAAVKERERELALLGQRQETAFRVFNVWLDVQQAKQLLKVAEQGVVDAKEHLRLAMVRNDAGVGLKADALRARAFLSERELDLISAENALRLARLRLGSAVESDAGSPLDAAGEVPAPVAAKSREELLRLALEQRPDVRQAATFVELAENGVKGARAAWLPTIYGSASYQMNDRDIPFGRDNDAWGVGAVLRWELFDGMRRQREAEGARATKTAAAELLQQRRAEIALEVEESLMMRDEAVKRLEVARHGREDAEEAVRLVTKRFDNSLATIADVLDAQTALDRSRTQVAVAGIASVRAAGRLNHAAGIFLQEVLR